jgi:hypothetical protein
VWNSYFLCPKTDLSGPLIESPPPSMRADLPHTVHQFTYQCPPETFSWTHPEIQLYQFSGYYFI